METIADSVPDLLGKPSYDHATAFFITKQTGLVPGKESKVERDF